MGPLSVPGRLVGGRYRLVRPLGAGGMGQVWVARDEVLNIDVAIKELQLDEGGSEGGHEEAVARAIAEARHAAALRDHPNIVAVHDVVTEDGGPWTVMRLVHGRSLAQELRSRRVLPVEEAAAVAGGVLRALAAAHRIGIIHRDVKPSNIMLADDGTVLLTDFGIAKNHADTKLTATGSIVGSLEYVAPERFDGGRDTPAVDVFGLGATLYEMLEGMSPFRRDTAVAIMAAIALGEAPPPLRAGRLAPLLAALLAKAPEARPDAVRALAFLGDGVGQGAAYRPVEGRSVVPVGEVAAHPPTVPDGETVPGSARPGTARRRRRSLIAIATAVAVAAAGLSWALVRESGTSDDSPVIAAPATTTVPADCLPVAATAQPQVDVQQAAAGTQAGSAVGRPERISVFSGVGGGSLKEFYYDTNASRWGPGDTLRKDDGKALVESVKPGTQPVAVLHNGITRVYLVDGNGHLIEAAMEKIGASWNVFDFTEWSNGPLSRSTPAVVVRDGSISIFTVDQDHKRLKEAYLNDAPKRWLSADLVEAGTGPTVDPGVSPAAIYDPKTKTTWIYTVDTGGGLWEWNSGPGGGEWSSKPLPDTVRKPAAGTAPVVAAYQGANFLFTVGKEDHLWVARLDRAPGGMAGEPSSVDLTAACGITSEGTPTVLVNGAGVSVFAVAPGSRHLQVTSLADARGKWSRRQDLFEAPVGVPPVAAGSPPAAVAQESGVWLAVEDADRGKWNVTGQGGRWAAKNVVKSSRTASSGRTG
ncbi:serine/threonine-protein kinase [Kitasatospora sp. NPDC057692]|uniref:serine/threonine-protein kinase n=1 Tax=Kitasatospora sp. NPDC057692 TaxID=3346215 RepID=UPI0036AE9A49